MQLLTEGHDCRNVAESIFHIVFIFNILLIMNATRKLSKKWGKRAENHFWSINQ